PWHDRKAQRDVGICSGALANEGVGGKGGFQKNLYIVHAHSWSKHKIYENNDDEDVGTIVRRMPDLIAARKTADEESDRRSGLPDEDYCLRSTE
ncbi:hypothetical protein LTR37_021249, partial [Vermiconidia calcicola]